MQQPDQPDLHGGPHPRGVLIVRADRAVGARSEWSPAVLVSAFSGAGTRNCPALTERDLDAVTERDVRGRMRPLVVERVVDRVPRALGACCAS
jgi:hypothetical protein